MKLYMTDFEILRSWRNAEDRKAQIGILAELNACSKFAIEKKLKQLGICVPKRTNNQPSKKIDDKIALKMWKEGKNDKEIAGRFGCAHGTVATWREKRCLHRN